MTQETLKLALEALTYIYTETTADEDELIHAAITAIKEALAQTQEPVAWMHVQGNFEEPYLRKLDDFEIKNGWTQYDLYTAPPQRKPLDHEKEIALREGYFADAEKTYFEARADCLNTAQNCKLFEAGFNRGWQAARDIKENT